MIIPAFLMKFVLMVMPFLSSIPYVGPIIKFLRSPLGKGILFATLLVGVFAYGFYRGDKHGDAQAALKASQAREEQHKIDFNNLNGRYQSAQQTIDSLNRLQSEAAVNMLKLRDELEKAKLQSTAAGAKHDPQALLDDKCNYTPLGRRRVR